MAKKCTVCNSCTDYVWIMPRRFFHCWLCDKYYDIIDGTMIEVDVKSIMGITQEQLDALYKKEIKPNERFS